MVTTGERKPWHAIFRLLERDERVFAVLLAVAMVAGLATLGLVPLRPRQQIDLNSLVLWFTLYKIGIFALVTVYPTRTRAIFLGALAIDLLLIFVLMFLTGGLRARPTVRGLDRGLDPGRPVRDPGGHRGHRG